MANRFCTKCGKNLSEKEFYNSTNLEKFPDGKMNMCKHCLTMHVDNWDPNTYMWILQDANVPYIKEEWDALMEKYCQDPNKVTGVTIIGRYLSKMKLKQWKEYTWADTEKIKQETINKKILAMQSQGFTEREINEQLELDRTPEKPLGVLAPPPPPAGGEMGTSSAVIDMEDQITDKDRLYLQLKWGTGYRADQWIRMEQLYNDMMKSYDIQSAGHKDTLIMVCKASLKANELIDQGDIISMFP